MKVGALILALMLVAVSHACGRAKLSALAPVVSGLSAHKPATEASPTPTPEKIDFAKQVRPILESRCTPCHFAGGKMYQHLPFDRAETIKLLGEKLFSRIKDEKEQHLIREFLSQQSE
ncbi:MAG TPA: hypothetical protein VEX60_06045 [Pyrinomonadaceae bacterium]|nr:hypothetical protein [Pyrinomonadaceae bacterium]